MSSPPLIVGPFALAVPAWVIWYIQRHWPPLPAPPGAGRARLARSDLLVAADREAAWMRAAGQGFEAEVLNDSLVVMERPRTRCCSKPQSKARAFGLPDG